MAKKYLVPIDMSGLEIQNFLAHNLATAPTGVGGKVYFNTTDHKLYYHNGTSWVDLTASSDTTYTLTKSGSTITLTDSNGNTWDVTDDDTTYSDATASASGLMSASDKTKLNGIASGAEVNVQSDWSQSDNTKDDYIKNKPTLGTAASKNSTTSIASGGVGLPTAGTVYDYVATAIGAVDAMRFKGTVNSNSDLPTTGVKVGDTYMVNTAGTYAGQTCEVGDLIIATATTPTWTVAQTNIDGAITSLTGQNGVSVTGSGSSRTIEFDASTAPKASTTAFGLMRVGSGLSASNGTVSASIRNGNVVLQAGNEYVSVHFLNANTRIIGYCAYIGTEEVMVDLTIPSVSSGMSYYFEIASPYTSDISIFYTYATENS